MIKLGTFNIQSPYHQGPADFYASRYMENGTLALVAIDAATHEPLTTFTVNLSEPLPEDHIFVKTYSEGESNLAVLESTGMIKRKIGTRDVGLAKEGAMECQLTQDVMDIIREAEGAS